MTDAADTARCSSDRPIALPVHDAQSLACPRPCSRGHVRGRGRDDRARCGVALVLTGGVRRRRGGRRLARRLARAHLGRRPHGHRRGVVRRRADRRRRDRSGRRRSARRTATRAPRCSPRSSMRSRCWRSSSGSPSRRCAGCSTPTPGRRADRDGRRRGGLAVNLVVAWMLSRERRRHQRARRAAARLRRPAGLGRGARRRRRRLLDRAGCRSIRSCRSSSRC